MCHQKAIAQRFTKLTHNLHDNAQGDLHPPFSLLLPLPLSLFLSASILIVVYTVLQHLAKCDNKLLSTLIYLFATKLC